MSATNRSEPEIPNERHRVVHHCLFVAALDHPIGERQNAKAF